MQQALETFLNTIESTPSLLALDGALRYVFPLLALVILLRCESRCCCSGASRRSGRGSQDPPATVSPSCTGRA